MPEPRRLVVIGAGGHAKVVLDLLREQAAYTVVGLTDRDTRAREVAGFPVIGDDSILAELRRQEIECAVAALGDNRLREAVAAHLLSLGFVAPAVVSRHAALSPRADIDRGAVIMPMAVVNADSTVGAFSIVNSGAVVEHDVVVGRCVHLAPNSALTAGVQVGDRSFVGAGATVTPGVRIGADVTVGAGACVVHDLPDGVTAVGVPARPLELRQ